MLPRKDIQRVSVNKGTISFGRDVYLSEHTEYMGIIVIRVTLHGNRNHVPFTSRITEVKNKLPQLFFF